MSKSTIITYKVVLEGENMPDAYLKKLQSLSFFSINLLQHEQDMFTVDIKSPIKHNFNTPLSHIRSTTINRARSLGMENFDLAFKTADDIRDAGIAEKNIFQGKFILHFYRTNQGTRAKVSLDSALPDNQTAAGCLDTYAYLRITELASTIEMSLLNQIKKTQRIESI